VAEDRVRASNLIDVQTVQLASQGDSAAFAELFNLLHTAVLNYIYHMIGDRQAAEDVTQDAFLRAHQRIGQLGPPWDFKSWVFRIASNLAIDHLRRERRFIDLDENLSMSDPPSTRRPSERGVQRRESRKAVWRSLNTLPTTYRQALVLRELNGLSYQEVSQALECSYDNARQLVHRARMRFRENHGLRVTLMAGVERCRELGNLLSAYHDGELEPGQQEMVRAHIAACPYCSQTEEDLRKVGAIFAGLVPIGPSAGWAGKVLESIRQQSPPPAGGGPSPPGATGGGAGLSAVKGAWSAGGGLGKLILLLVGFAGLGGLIAIGAYRITGLMNAGVPYAGPAPDSGEAEPSPSPVRPLPSATPQSGVAGVPSAVPLTRTPTTTPTATPSPTPEDTQPYVIARMNSNCRLGPDARYEVIGFLLEEQSAPVEGRNAQMTWWWILQQDGPGHCWVWNDLVWFYGDPLAVPIIEPPPLPDTEPPDVSIQIEPSGAQRPSESDTVTWTVRAQDEVGVERIELWIKPPYEKIFVLANRCESSFSCSYQGGPYPPGLLEYYANAWDAAGNLGESGELTLAIYSTVR
jgi:RNA polymerase sigma-70 factor (ECF subfamily)